MHELIQVLEDRKIHFNAEFSNQDLSDISLNYETQEDFVHIGVSAIELNSWGDAMAAWGIATTEGISSQVVSVGDKFRLISCELYARDELDELQN